MIEMILKMPYNVENDQKYFKNFKVFTLRFLK